MMNIEIRGMSFFRNDDGTHPYRTLALAEVYLPDLAMTIRDVRLTWSKDRSFVAHAPSSKAVARPAIQWFHRSEFAQQLSHQLRDMFERMGGKMPEEMTAKEHNAGVAARRIADRREAKRLGYSSLMPEYGDLEAVEGLARTLSVEHLEAARVLG